MIFPIRFRNCVYNSQ